MTNENAPIASLNPNIAWLLWESAMTWGDDPAILERDESLSFHELHLRAGAFATTLKESGIGPGDRVAIFLRRGGDAAAAFFGSAAVGAISIMINENSRPRQIEYITRHSTASVLIADPADLDRLGRALDLGIPIISATGLAEPDLSRPVGRTGADPAQIIYTSGSTGAPKGVTISHANLWAGFRSVTEYLQITRADRIASLLPFSFDYGFNQLLTSVGNGASLVVERSPLPHSIIEGMRREGVTVLPAVPPLWIQLLQAESFAEPIPTLRAMTNTGGRLPTGIVDRIRRAQPSARLFLMYGLTEAFRATYLPPEELDRRPDSIGRAIPGAEIMVLREDGSPAEPGEVGELVQRGPTVALGYWDDDRATTQVFRANPLRPPGTPEAERVVYSGDLVRRDHEGFLYFLGRRDAMIKSLGYRVSPDEVSEALLDSGEVTEVVITSEPDPVRGQRIIAHIVLSPGGSLGRLHDFARAELPRHLVPSRLVTHQALPRTPSGKYDLVKLAGVNDSLREEAQPLAISHGLE